MPEPSSMCQSRLLLGKAPGESIFTLHCRLLYYNFNSGSGKPRQPVSDSLRGSSRRIHLDRPPYCLIPPCVQGSIPIDPTWVLRFSPIHF
jgi:hypothetical protein